MIVIEKVGKEGLNLVAELDLEVVRGLYRRGLIYLEVPVYPDDHFQGQFQPIFHLSIHHRIYFSGLC